MSMVEEDKKCLRIFYYKKISVYLKCLFIQEKNILSLYRFVDYEFKAFYLLPNTPFLHLQYCLEQNFFQHIFSGIPQ